MFNKFHIFLTFIFLEYFFKDSLILHNNIFKYSSNFIVKVNAKTLSNEPINDISFKKENIQQAEVFIAELSDDLKTRLHQILNDEIYYRRHFIDDDNDKDESLITDNQKENKDKNYDEQKVNKNSNTIKRNDDNQDNINLYTNKNNDDNNNFSENVEEYSKDKGDKFKIVDYISSFINKVFFNDKNNLIKINSDTKYLKGKAKSFNNSTIKTNNGGILTNKKTPSSFYHAIDINEEDIINQDSSEVLINTEKPFDFSISCMDDEEECHYINNKLENAGNLIANIFNIYETIKVDVHILPFCKHMHNDNCDNITALTYPPSFVSLNITNQGIYSYPQALIKQFNIKDRVKNLASYDISLYFNTDYLKENNYGNYFLVVTHEIIHGMGFFHLMTTASSAFKMTFPEDRIIPQPLVNNYRTSSGEERAYQGWIPFTVFDRYIVEVNHPDYYIHKGLQNYLEDVQVHKLRSEEEVIQHFDNLSIPPPNINYSKDLAKSFSTREAIGFRTYDGEVVTLQTFKKYEPKSSISHIHSPFSCDSSIDCYIPKEKLEEVDENYLMYYTIITRPVNELVNRFSSESSHGIVGEKIVKIMKTIGWTEKKDLDYFKEYQNLILNREAKFSSSASSYTISKPFNYFTFITTIILSFFIIFFLFE